MVDDEEDNSDDEIKQIEERKKVGKNKLLRKDAKSNQIFSRQKEQQKRINDVPGKRGGRIKTRDG